MHKCFQRFHYFIFHVKNRPWTVFLRVISKLFSELRKKLSQIRLESKEVVMNEAISRYCVLSLLVMWPIGKKLRQTRFAIKMKTIREKLRKKGDKLIFVHCLKALGLFKGQFVSQIITKYLRKNFHRNFFFFSNKTEGNITSRIFNLKSVNQNK